MFKKRYMKLLIMGCACLCITIVTTLFIMKPFTFKQMLIIIMAGFSSTFFHISSFAGIKGKPLKIEDLNERTLYKVIAEGCANTVLIVDVHNEKQNDSRFLRVCDPTRFKCGTVFVVIEKLKTDDISRSQLNDSSHCFKEDKYFIKVEEVIV